MATPSQSSSAGSTASKKFRTLLGRYWLPLILVIIAVIFISQNTQRVSVDFLFISFRSWLWLVLTVVAVGGVIAGWFLGRNSVKAKKD